MLFFWFLIWDSLMRTLQLIQPLADTNQPQRSVDFLADVSMLSPDHCRPGLGSWLLCC